MFAYSCGFHSKEDSIFVINPHKDVLLWSKKDLPLKVGIENTFTDIEADQFIDLIGQYEQAAGLTFVDESYFFEPKNFVSVEDYYLHDKDQIGIHKLTQPTEGIGERILAQCQVYLKEVGVVKDKKVFQIVHGDIMINEKNFTFTDGGGNGTYDLQTLMLHELGHFFGIAKHNSEGVMAQNMNTTDIKRILDPLTQDMISELYNNRDYDEVFEKHEYSQLERSPASYLKEDDKEEILFQFYLMKKPSLL